MNISRLKIPGTHSQCKPFKMRDYLISTEFLWVMFFLLAAPNLFEALARKAIYRRMFFWGVGISEDYVDENWGVKLNRTQ